MGGAGLGGGARPASPLDYPSCVAAGALPLLHPSGPVSGDNNEDTDPDIIPNQYGIILFYFSSIIRKISNL